MLLAQPPPDHHWYTPADCALLIPGARQYGNSWRAPCPAHHGKKLNLHLWEDTDPQGFRYTRLYCHSQHCDIRALCEALALEMSDLYELPRRYRDSMGRFPRAQSPRVARLKTMEEPTPDEVAQILLEEMIATGAELGELERQKVWTLAQASPKARARFTKALEQAHNNPWVFWRRMHDEYTD